MPTITVPHNWKPRPYQMAAWKAWEHGVTRSLLFWHRRAGKDEISLHKAAVAAHTRVANYWHCLPMYAQARKAIWEAVNPHSGKRRIDEAFPQELRARTNNHEMMIEFKSGSIWRVVGSDAPDSLVGAPPAGIVFSEWALSNPSSWGYLAPILAENNGWADFITTPRGRNHAWSMYGMARTNPDWFAEVLTVNETGFPVERVEAQRVEYRSIFGEEAGDALIEQEYYCSFEAAVLGAYWGKEIALAEREGRIREVAYDPNAPVHTVWDLGVGDATAIWFFQIIGPYILIVDYYENHGYGADHYCDVVRGKPYKQGIAWVPQDAKVREWAGETKPDGAAKQRIEVLIARKMSPRLVPKHGKEDGINAARTILHRCHFHATNCAKGLECLRMYRAEWDDDKKMFIDRPHHDWTSHGSDAFRYLAMAYKEIVPTPQQLPGRTLTIGSLPSEQARGQVTLEDLWRAEKQNQRRRGGGRI